MTQVLIGLPDTVWFPENAYYPALNQEMADVNLVLFPVENPALFDAVVCDPQNFVTKVEVKVPTPQSNWIWGAITTSGEAFRSLKLLWEARHREDEYLGTLLNAYIDAGNTVRGHHVGETYIDVGTMEGFHRAQDFLRGRKPCQSCECRLLELLRGQSRARRIQLSTNVAMVNSRLALRPQDLANLAIDASRIL